ncbi:hypothetical protein ABPG72_002640 [Tetrahymena utriculariae]
MDFSKFEKYFISDKFRIISEDVTFFFQNYKPKTPTQDAKINEQTGQMLKLSIAGVCLGFALSLSLRRYLPNQFGEISLKRMILDTTMVMGGYVYFSKTATYHVYQNLTPLRKELVDECDQDYLKHLMRLRQFYPQIYTHNTDLFKDIYTTKELKEWVEKNESIAIIFGLQPHHFDGVTDQLQSQLQTNRNLQNIQQETNKQQSQENVYSFNFNEENKKSSA